MAASQCSHNRALFLQEGFTVSDYTLFINLILVATRCSYTLHHLLVIAQFYLVRTTQFILQRHLTKYHYKTMGVKNLWKLLEPAGRPIRLESLEGLILAIGECT